MLLVRPTELYWTASDPAGEGTLGSNVDVHDLCKTAGVRVGLPLTRDKRALCIGEG